jgi:hypothetical protein
MPFAEDLFGSLAIHLVAINDAHETFTLPPFYTFDFRGDTRVTWEVIAKRQLRIRPVYVNPDNKQERLCALQPPSETPDHPPVFAIIPDYVPPFIALQGHVHSLSRLHSGQQQIPDRQQSPWAQELRNTVSLLRHVLHKILQACTLGTHAALTLTLPALEHWWFLALGGYSLTVHSLQTALRDLAENKIDVMGDPTKVLTRYSLIKQQQPFRVTPGDRWSA